MIIAIKDNCNDVVYRVRQRLPGDPRLIVTRITVDRGNWAWIHHTGGKFPIAWYKPEWLTIIEESDE